VARAHLVPLAAAVLAGVASDVLGVTLATLAIGVLAAAFARRVPLSTRTNALAALAIGVLDAHVFAHPPQPSGDAHLRRFAAIVEESDARGLQGASTTLRLDDGSRALATFYDDAPEVGDRLIVRGEREAFDEARNPGETSARDIEAQRGVSWRLGHARILARAAADPRDASLWLARLRAYASAQLHRTLDEPGATILAGALWGERGPLPPELRAEFQDTGTVHVLVTAGLHLGVVAALALVAFRALRFGRVAASLGTIAIVWLYAAFSGGHLPAVRAATMLSFALLARAAGREAFSWNALAAAAIAIALVRPAAVLSVSFGLSFGCVAAILSFARPVAQALERYGTPRAAAELFGVAIAAQLGTWPLSAATFLVIAPYAPVANAAVVPAVGVAMLLGFVALFCAPIPPLAALVNNLLTSVLEWIVGSVRFVGALPGAHVVATPPPLAALLTYAAALALAGRLVALARPRSAVALVACASALCLWPPRVPNHHLRIVAIDVGQADAILIRTPSGRAYLVDAGGRLERGGSNGASSAAEDIGERIVVPFLLRAGVHRVDAILLSHPHGDHAGGVAPVLRELGAGGFADSGQSYPGHAYHDALDAAREKQVPLLEPRGGDVWRSDDGVTFRFYGPTMPYIAGSRNDINSNSLVFRLEYGRFAMLFVGDAGAETEQRLLAAQDDLRADVLKVGHHGSAYGTTPDFLRAVSPHDAVISVGRNNLFGHPAPATLAALVAANIAVHRTDRTGAVSVESDGSAFTVHDYLDNGAPQPPLRAP
jgi:competence protein ComEC